MTDTPDTHTPHMQRALAACRRGIERGQSPFGACIVRIENDKPNILADTHNHVRLNTDATAHAEVMAIRDACRSAKSIHLPGATIYTTTEPCPMCFTAIHWARIDRIVYAARIEDAQRFGFNELTISNTTMKREGGARVELIADVMRDEAVALFELWQKRGGVAY